MTTELVRDTDSQGGPEPGLDHEVIVIGAGVAGIYQIKRLTDAGVNAVVLEAGSDLGGTWYWNRYPGSRFDSESYTYGYSFSKELLDEWHWKERFSPQPETLKYLNFVAEKFDLRQHMRFDAKVEAMTWNDDAGTWTVRLKNGEELTSRYVLAGVGLLSVPTPPRYEGMDDFEGISFHTFHWPPRAPGPHRQASGRHRDRGHRHPAHSGHRARGGAPERVPASTQLGGAAE